MAKKLIFLIEMENESLLAAGLILELNGYKVMISGKSEDPVKKILSHENSRKVTQRVYFLLFLAAKAREETRIFFSHEVTRRGTKAFTMRCKTS
ncbi:MAG: hypothetical protein GTN82_25895 [Candidatus Aminicenantes bacterium]|nr:hypothetical protein [Candidatus Aminicenantes bacterium]